MDFKFIEKLAKLLKQENIAEIEIKNPQTGNHIKLKSNSTPISIVDNPPLKNPQERISTHAPQVATTNESQTPDTNIKQICSPFVGTFYSSPAPDKEDFISVGSNVKKGQTLCIVEAMKMMNEIEAETDGIITEILIKNEHPVEYNQALFKIKI
jgi:acetyl-CoA carboxylase biotin carboxyl carrier protein